MLFDRGFGAIVSRKRRVWLAMMKMRGVAIEIGCLDQIGSGHIFGTRVELKICLII